MIVCWLYVSNFSDREIAPTPAGPGFYRSNVGGVHINTSNTLVAQPWAVPVRIDPRDLLTGWYIDRSDCSYVCPTVNILSPL